MKRDAEGFITLTKPARKSKSSGQGITLLALAQVLDDGRCKALHTRYTMDYKPKSWQIKAWRTVGSKVEANYSDKYRAFPKSVIPWMQEVVFTIVRFRIVIKKDGRTVRVLNVGDTPTASNILNGQRGMAGKFRVIDSTKGFTKYIAGLYDLAQSVMTLMENHPEYDIVNEAKIICAMSDRTLKSYAGSALDIIERCGLIGN